MPLPAPDTEHPAPLRNLKVTVEYDGTDYRGFQRHPGRRTIQGELEWALSRITKETVHVAGAGRTDAGVHAAGQVVSFRTAGTIPTERIPVALNSLLPRDIVAHEAVEVPNDFHARYSARSRSYRYVILNREIPSALGGRFHWYVPQPVDIVPMREAAEILRGTHDFTSFSSTEMDTPSRVRDLTVCEIERVGDQIVFALSANAFLHSMVRIIVGTLTEVGQGRRSVEDVQKILEAKDRRLAGRTAPPQGLVLVEVIY